MRISWTDSEIETLRQETIAEHGELTGDPQPGSMYCHEALHMANFLGSSVEEELACHPAITANPEWHRLAFNAAGLLQELYQAIGDKHLNIERN